MDDLLTFLASALAPTSLGFGRRKRLKLYRSGEPVLIRVGFMGGYPWSTRLLCHEDRLWAVSNLGYPNERRQELLRSSLGYKVERSGWKFGPGVTVFIEGEPVRIVSTEDLDLLREAVERWHRGSAIEAS